MEAVQRNLSSSRPDQRELTLLKLDPEPGVAGENEAATVSKCGLSPARFGIEFFCKRDFSSFCSINWTSIDFGPTGMAVAFFNTHRGFVGEL